MFIFNWLFGKLGYMPKITTQVEVVKPWPFPAEVEVKSLAEEPVPIKKPRVRKTRALPSRAARAKTALTKKVK
jgi:hypothetical protein